MIMWGGPRNGMGPGCKPEGGISRAGSIPAHPTKGAL